MNFHPRDSHSSPLFKSNHILKFENDILIEDILLISVSINQLLPPILIFGSRSSLALTFTIIKRLHLQLQTASSSLNI